MNAIFPLQTAAETTSASALTLADARAALATWTDISDAQRANFGAAISGVARICDLPEAGIALDCAWLNQRLFRRGPAAFGFTAQRFGKIVRMLRQIMRRLGAHAPELPARDELVAEWRDLLDRLPEYRRVALASFIGFCSHVGIVPAQVDSEALAAFEAWSTQQIIYDDARGRARRIASNWNWARNAVAGWPQVELVREGMRRQYTLPLEAYPASFQEDVQCFADRLAGEDIEEIYPDDVADPASSRSHRRRRHSLRPRTIDGRLDQIRRAAAALVLRGLSIEEIRSLRDLVDPIDRARTIRKFYRDRHGREPNSQVCGILECLRQIAAHHCRLPPSSVEKIRAWAADARPDWELGMTEKNQERLRALVQPLPRAKLLNFPEELVRRATGAPSARGRKRLIGRDPAYGLTPLAQARLVALAVALEILLVFPMRRANLAGLRIDKHLQWLQSRKPVSHIFLSAAEMKGKVGLQFPLPEPTSELIELYLKTYRPLLAAPSNPYLFPGPGLRGRSAHELAISLTKLVEQELGLKINLHLMRHFAAWVYLNRNPGSYEVIRRVLGHKSLRVTTACYTGLEIDAIAQHFDASVLADREASRAIAEAAFAKPTSRKGRASR